MNINKKSLIAIAAIIVLIGSYLIADSILFDGIKPIKIRENGLHANYYVQKQSQPSATVILVGGGVWGDYWAQHLAKSGFVGLSLPYYREEGLPPLPEEIDLAYFETAIKWLNQQPEVNNHKIIVMGASRNAELALVIASKFPDLVHGVVAYSPSSVSWSNTVLPFNSDTLKPSWQYNGQPIPYLAMEKIKGDNSQTLETLAYWKSGLARTQDALKASIPVEQINGPILLFSGTDDQVWPSSFMANQIEKRLDNHLFSHEFQNIQYENAGHLISRNPETISETRTGNMTINGKNYEFEFGGTVEGDQKAKSDAKNKLMEFLRGL